MPPRISLVDVKDVVLRLLVPDHDGPVVLPHPGHEVENVHLAVFDKVGRNSHLGQFGEHLHGSDVLQAVQAFDEPLG